VSIYAPRTSVYTSLPCSLRKETTYLHVHVPYTILPSHIELKREKETKKII